MRELLDKQSITTEVASFLQELVRARYNILISGGTGSGKTTFLNVLSGFVEAKERVITIEDSAELQLQGLDNLVRLETRNGNQEGCRDITIRDLIRTSLRMRPDRIVVGEVRGAEAADMLQALNTGHDGSMSTAHANSAEDLLFRLESMVLMGMDIPLSAVRRQIASGVDIIVHVSRMRDRSRRVEEIREVLGCDEKGILTQVLYAFEEHSENESGEIKGTLKKRGDLIHVQKLKKAGTLSKYTSVSC
jgi:pilus assembly protein CpaF